MLRSKLLNHLFDLSKLFGLPEPKFYPFQTQLFIIAIRFERRLNEILYMCAQSSQYVINGIY